MSHSAMSSAATVMEPELFGARQRGPETSTCRASPLLYNETRDEKKTACSGAFLLQERILRSTSTSQYEQAGGPGEARRCLPHMHVCTASAWHGAAWKATCIKGRRVHGSICHSMAMAAVRCRCRSMKSSEAMPPRSSSSCVCVHGPSHGSSRHCIYSAM